MISKEERRANLMRASAMTRVQDAQIQNSLNGMSDEEIQNFVDSNPDVAEMLTVGADTDNSGIIINYANQPNKQEEISINLPWEGNFAVGQPSERVNLFQVGSSPSSGITFGNNCCSTSNSPFNYNSSNDERIKKYTGGMKLYGMNPYNFYNANQMVEYFNNLEQQREYAQNQKYGWALLMARFSGSEEMMKWAEGFKFKPADQLYEEQQEAIAKAEKERQEALQEDESDIIYDVYDCNGVRFQRACSVIISDEDGNVIARTNHNRDSLGRSYVIRTQMQDRKEQYELQQMYTQAENFKRQVETFTRLFNKQYTDNIERWDRWEREGLSKEEQWARFEDERIDWKKHEKLLDRALRTAAYSKDSFREILSSCCNTNFDYSNRSKFFSLSYHFERDLHYKTLISTPEEMDNDPMVHQKLQQEYDIKRKLFMDKVNAGDLGAPTATDARFRHTFAKPIISELTLEDYKKPENQFMYTQTVTPELATPNMFIPPDLGMTEEQMAKLNIRLDENGNVLPQKRVIGYMTVDDDTGEVLSQHEEEVIDFDTGSECNKTVTGYIKDEDLEEYF